MNAHDQLLLCEGVCRQLGIISYHPDVERWRGGRQRTTPKTPETQSPSQTGGSRSEVEVTASTDARVPTIRVNLVQSACLLPHQSLVVDVSLAGDGAELADTYVLEPAELKCGLLVDPALISVPADGDACAVLTNPTGCSMVLEEGNSIGEAVPATLVCPPESTDDQPGAARTQPALRQVQSKSMTWRRNKLAESIKGLVP